MPCRFPCLMRFSLVLGTMWIVPSSPILAQQSHVRHTHLSAQQQKNANGRLVALWLNHDGQYDEPKAKALTPQTVQNVLLVGADINIKDENGLTPLMNASNSGNLPVIRLLLSRGAKVNLKRSDGVTALMETNSPQVARLLIAHGADTNIQTRDCGTPLTAAVSSEETDIVKVLLEGGARVDDRDLQGQTALTCSPSATITQMLLAHGASVNLGDRNGYTALMSARTAAMARLLIAHGANPTAIDNSGNPVLSSAQTPEVAQVLLDHHVDINARAYHDGTALIGAAATLNPAMVQFLLNHGAFVNLQNSDGETALIITARFEEEQYIGNGAYGISVHSDPIVQDFQRLLKQMTKEQATRTAVIKLLLDAGANPNLATSQGESVSGETALMAASSTQFPFGYLEGDMSASEMTRLHMVMDLAQEKQSKTAFLTAVDSGDDRVIQLLLDHGADINAKDEDGKTPLINAASAGNASIADLLLRNGANIDAKDKHGKTALMWAVEAETNIHQSTSSKAALDRYIATIRMLLDKGADASVQDDKAHTALSIATAAHAAQLIAMLQIYAATPRKNTHP